MTKERLKNDGITFNISIRQCSDIDGTLREMFTQVGSSYFASKSTLTGSRRRIFAVLTPLASNVSSKSLGDNFDMFV